MPAKMRSTKRPTIGALTLKTLGAAVASALLFSNANAAALGKLTVLSALGQPLRAEIALRSVSRDEAGALVAKLASADAFRQANIDFNVALLSLRFAIEQRGDRQFIRVTSTQPLNEPFVDMLLELSGPDGRLIREYTFLLDPPDLRAVQAPQVAPVTVGQPGAGAQPPAASPAQTIQRKPLPAPAPKTEMPSPAAERATAHPQSYRVKNGDTLTGIASQYKSAGVSLDQMLLALYQANPDAFIDKNMNRMKAGEILSMPDADAARAVNEDDARDIIRAQARDFNNYRSRLAGQVAAGPARQSAEGTRSAGGKITAKVEESATPAAESKDRLKLSNATATQGAGKNTDNAASAEDRIAQEKAIEEANARVKELEKNVSDLQKIIELKNKSLAEQQKQAGSAKTAPATAAATKPTPHAAAAKPPVHVPPPAPGFFDGVLDNPMLLPGLGALLVALGALGVYNARRKKPGKQFEDSLITDSSLKANSLFGSTGGQSVDTNNSVFNSSFSPSSSHLDSNEVDPVAEADVYIAYGRDAQAEEILKEALRTQPGRHAVRVKLLEIYSNRKDLRAFEVLATELYGLTKGEGAEWAQAATMGAAIDPNNPLYAGSKTAKDSVTGGAMVEPTRPLDDQGLATLLATTHSDATLQPGSGLDADTSYFDNTALAADIPLELPPEGEPEAQPEAETQAQPGTEKALSNDLDFDLGGMMNEIEAPNTIPLSMPAEPEADLASIDFDFLDAPNAGAPEAAAETEPQSAAEPAAESAAPLIPPTEAPLEIDAGSDIVPSVEASNDMAPLEFELPADDVPQAKQPAPEVDPLDFDLSGISLELDPGETGVDRLQAEGEPEQQASGGIVSSNDAEMATKLDLALAYQEIGDKEGARELLDEVLKGGSAEQSERAKTLLLELA